MVTDTGAFLKNLDQFDPVEFGITSKDAKLMNLGTRKLIETTFLALLDSGIDYRGRNVGCYMSAVAHDMFSVSGHVSYEVMGRLTSLLTSTWIIGRRRSPWRVFVSAGYGRKPRFVPPRSSRPDRTHGHGMQLVAIRYPFCRSSAEER